MPSKRAPVTAISHSSGVPHTPVGIPVVAVQIAEVTAELASVAAVVRDHAGYPAASVALTYPIPREGTELAARCEAAVRAAAAEITRRLRGVTA